MYLYGPICLPIKQCIPSIVYRTRKTVIRISSLNVSLVDSCFALHNQCICFNVRVYSNSHRKFPATKSTVWLECSSR